MSAGGWDYLAFYVYFCFVWSDVDDLNYSNDFAFKHFSAALSFLSDDLRAWHAYNETVTYWLWTYRRICDHDCGSG